MADSNNTRMGKNQRQILNRIKENGSLTINYRHSGDSGNWTSLGISRKLVYSLIEKGIIAEEQHKNLPNGYVRVFTLTEKAKP